jgi:putative transposase
MSRSCSDCAVRDLAVLVLHLLATVARLAGPGGARSVLAESVLVKHQLLILNRSRKRSPNLRPSDRMVAGLCALFMRPGRLIRSAIVFKPSTLLSFHRALIQRKYRGLFSAKGPIKPGPKGPSQEIIAAVVDMKQRNRSWGCPRIAQQITLAFGIPINKDVVRRILATRYQPTPDSAGPSWLTVFGHASHRTHAGLGGLTPEPRTDDDSARPSVSKYRWRPHCRGLYQTPIAA